jgi:hypothetical protein
MIFDDCHAQTHAQLMRYGTDVAKWGSKLLTLCAVNGLGVAEKSLLTTLAREAQ